MTVGHQCFSTYMWGNGVLIKIFLEMGQFNLLAMKIQLSLEGLLSNDDDVDFDIEIVPLVLQS